MAVPPALETRDLTRYYGSTVGIEDLDLLVEPGEVFGFLGPNGAGKTTTIRILLDLLPPTRGTSFLLGEPAGNAQVRSRIGYLPGELSLDGRMTGSQTLTFLAKLRRRRGVDPVSQRSLCRRLGLTEADLARRVREYSRGMKQKLGLVSAFQHQPDLLILDEPTTGLDPLVREEVFALMGEARTRGATVFHSSHVLSEVDRTCDRVAILRNGRLVALFTVAEARNASVRSMVVEFEGDPPLERLKEAGATLDEVEGGRVTLRVPGTLHPLLQILAHHPVEHLSFPEAGLEEAFTAFYSGDPPRGRFKASDNPPAAGPSESGVNTESSS